MTHYNIPKTLANLWDSHPDQIVDITNERADGSGYWVYFAPGWIYPRGETHFIHEDTVAECLAGFRTIKRCTCAECQRIVSHDQRR